MQHLGDRPCLAVIGTEPDGHSHAPGVGGIRKHQAAIALLAGPDSANQTGLANRFDQRRVGLALRPGEPAVPAVSDFAAAASVAASHVSPQRAPADARTGRLLGLVLSHTRAGP